MNKQLLDAIKKNVKLNPEISSKRKLPSSFAWRPTVKQPEASQTLSRIRELYGRDEKAGTEAAKMFSELRNDPSSKYYAPHASGKSNYTELTNYFGVGRFDNDFFVQYAGLTNYLRYGASGTPLAPTKKSKPEEVAAYQYYRAQRADEYTRTLENQWRELQKELSVKASPAYDMDDDSIIDSIDWNKYGALKDYEDNVRIRNIPLLTRPVSYSEESLQGVLYAIREGKKVGQTDRDYLPELTDYYMEKSAQEEKRMRESVSKIGLPEYTQPGTQDAGLVFDATITDRVDAISGGTIEPGVVEWIAGTQNATERPVGNPDSPVWKTDEELDAIDAQKRQERQDKIDFNNLQYKMFVGQELTEEEKNRWTELYPTQGHGKPGASVPSGLRSSASGGGSALTVEQQNDAWVEKYKGIMQAEYGDGIDSHQSTVEQLAELRNSASALGMTVEQYISEAVGSRPQWLDDLDYKQKRKENPELITRLRPIEEVLPDYLAGNELSEAEYEFAWRYDKDHPNLLSGMKQVRAADISMPVDMRRQLGTTAFDALSAADSEEISTEESNALILSVGQDMDNMFGQYDTLEKYYAANPERAAELQVFTAEAKAREEEKVAQDEARSAEEAKAIAQMALVTLSDYASGAELNDGQKDFMNYMKSAPITEADKGDATYKQLYADTESIIKTTDFGVGHNYNQSVAEAYGSADNPFGLMATMYNPTQMAYKSEAQRMAKDILDTDTRLAKTAGMTLTQYYEMFPEMKRTPQDIIGAAQKAVSEKWDWEADNRKSFFEYIFGVNQDSFEGDGVGAGTVLEKGVDAGTRQFAQGFMGFWRNYFTETENKDEVIAQNRSRLKYSGAMGRTKARKDFEQAISAITDPEHREYWENYLTNTKDILNLPFDFTDEAVLNTLYENKKAIDLIHSYMVENGKEGEYAAFVVVESLVDTGLSTGTALAATTLTGNPAVGTAIAFGPRAAYEGSEAMRAAGFPQFQRNAVGLGVAGITMLTESIALKGLQNSASAMRGSLNLMKSAAMNGGAGYFKNLGMKIAFGTATIGVKLAENAAEQSSQEFIESVFTDVWLNIAGAQNKDASAMFEDGVKEGVMAAILSPFLSGQAYIMTSKGKLQITDEMRAAAQKYMGSLTSEALQNPETVAKIIDANASEMTIETLTNGALADVDTSVVEQTKEEVKAAEEQVTGASEAFTDARMEYADEMQKYVESGEVISDADHDILIQTLENAGKLYQSAKNTFASLSEKLKQAQGGLDRLIAGIITSARAEGKVKAQADILSEMATRRMEANTQKADEITEATVRIEQPLPENVSNEGDPLAQDIESGIMGNDTQGEVESRNSEGAGEIQKIPWDSWQNYEKVTVNDHIYAKVGDRLYSEHAVNRMQPSGNRFGPYIYQGLYGEDYGRSIAPKFVEDVICSVEPTIQSNGNLAYISGTVKVITNPQGAVITIVTYVK